MFISYKKYVFCDTELCNIPDFFYGIIYTFLIRFIYEKKTYLNLIKNVYKFFIGYNIRNRKG